MKSILRQGKALLLTGVLLFLSGTSTAGQPPRSDRGEGSPGYIATDVPVVRNPAVGTVGGADALPAAAPAADAAKNTVENTAENTGTSPAAAPVAADTAGIPGKPEAPATPAARQSESPSQPGPGHTDEYKNGYDAGYRVGYAAGYLQGRRAAGAPGYGAATATGAHSAASLSTDTDVPGLCSAAMPEYAGLPAEDTTARQRRYVHSIGAEFRPEYIPPTNLFLAGANMADKPIERSLAAHLRYSFRFRPGSRPDRIYGGVYQGIGASYYSFGNREELGNPVAVYLFQGARIARISPRVSFNYEWNFGLSFGWKPYDGVYNRSNIMMGSKINAYLNVDFYLNWLLTSRLELTTGASLTHFSNGNTKFPNAGLNSVGMKLGLVYSFGRVDNPLLRIRDKLLTPPFPRHFSYDLVLFGSWRCKGVAVGDKQYAAPDAYGVAGFNFATMYNFGYKFRAGVSVDGVYDGSANVYTEDYIYSPGNDPGYTFYTPSFDKQIALGLSGRAEFVMPYFTVGFGLGFNLLHRGGDLKSFYQMLTLKVGVTHNTFVHVGYCLKDFQTPNYLMLGAGFRFNNKYPRLR